MQEILVVEDNPPTREIYAYLLRGWGYQVCLAASTNEAISLIRTGCIPDAIVADYNLGGSDTGVAAIRAIEWQLGRPVPAVMVTGEYSLPNVGLPTFRKPIAPEQLKKALDELFARTQKPLSQRC